jgi:hypothetical protein
MASFLNRAKEGNAESVKRTKNLHCNAIFLTSFPRLLQDTSMKHEHAKPHSKPPKSVFQMTDKEKELTGVGGLSDQQKANLDEWIKDNVLAPGHTD